MRVRHPSRLLAFTLGIIILLAASSALADAALVIKADSAADGTVTATVSLDGAKSAAGIYYGIAYDSSMLSLQSAEKGTLEGNYTIDDSQKGKVKFAWYHETGVSTGASAKLMTLRFTPRKSDRTVLQFDSETIIMIIDSEFQNIAAATQPAVLELQTSSEKTVSGVSSSGSIQSDGVLAMASNDESLSGEDMLEIEVMSSKKESSAVFIIIGVVVVCSCAGGFLLWKYKKKAH